MVVTSSYSNNHDMRGRSDNRDLIAEDPVWRRVPVAEALEQSRNEIAKCDRATGHILILTDEGKKIICRECYAEWKDEGF
jgi:hypothetical protein